MLVAATHSLAACTAKAVTPIATPAPTDLTLSRINPPGATPDAARAGPPSELHGNLSGVSPLTIKRTQTTGKLRDHQMTEISGLSASRKYPGLLYAINDSGNKPTLFAINETGELLEQWRLNVKNRDWEDMTRMRLSGEDFIVVGDTGDNLRVHKSASLLFFAEPAMPAELEHINPVLTVRFKYEDGPRNVEAFAAIGNSLYLLSKEPVSLAGPSPSGIYHLELPENPIEQAHGEHLIAKRVGSMPLRSAGLESRLAAALAGVDLSHPTALAFDPAGDMAYILTYREVLRVRRGNSQTWAEVFSQPAELVHSHKLAQAEALTLSPGRAIWFTSENAGAPLWAIPIDPPL